MTLSSTDYALLARDSYQDPILNKTKNLGGVDYVAFDVADNPHTGFQATAYRREDTGEVIIAYRGTEFGREPVHDGGVDAGMVLLGVNAQTPDALAFTQRVVEAAKVDADLHHKPLAVTVTGHSLGGTLAEINAAKFGLKGETFNAYGAAGLMQGVPEGGHQVVDHVRAGDVVSAASPHFGEVRTYASQADIDTLGKAGYRDDGSALSLRNPVKAIDFDAHAIDNFTPDNKRLGQSIINPESEARYKAHEGMIDRYRNDVGNIRMGLSAGWEIPHTLAEGAHSLGHAVAERVEEGVHAVEHAVEHVAHEVKETVDHVREDVSAGLHAVGEKASGAWNTLTHPGAWFEHDKPPVKLDEPAHPDHALFGQARAAVHQLDASRQRTPDQASDNLAASLTVAARRDGLERIDRAVLSDDASRTYGVQGELNSPLKRITEVSTQQATSTPVAESSDAWRQVAQQNQQAQVTAQQMHRDDAQRVTPAPGL